MLNPTSYISLYKGLYTYMHTVDISTGIFSHFIFNLAILENLLRGSEMGRVCPRSFVCKQRGQKRLLSGSSHNK